MTPEQQLVEAASPDPLESLSLVQKETLQQAVAKIVVVGAQKGVTIDQMIELLKAGLTVSELLEYVGARSGDIA
jgi:hypothetical protein